ncbi:hypothetical protein N0V93_006596 [Gnomoniopsis smithogilvyi]|uniref:Ubiquitin 3 binding protein But2 C-terminal domain-containing protein n=1 Tax=Gnomoniopsis smithogilvyi TaxID=1191159 RepID=A0A9W9CUV5_9PEZI|nr:hypothetical protein N0V93_006596 [Gnomoniopsis smithogilvyi]
MQLQLLPILLTPTVVIAGIIPTLSIPGLGGLPKTTSKSSATATAVPISKPTGKAITSVSYAGSGCPSGTVSSSLSSDQTVITLGFDDFQAYIGPGTILTDRSKSCKLLITLNYPPGYSFGVVSSTYHGYAQLDVGVTGSFSSVYFLTSLLSTTFSTSTSILGGGAYSGGTVYTQTNTISTSNLVLSPCGLLGLGSRAGLNIAKTISLTSNNASATGQMTEDDATFGTTQRVSVKWFSC